MADAGHEWLLGRALQSAALLAGAGYLTALISFPANLVLMRMVGPRAYGNYALAVAALQMVYLLGGWSFHLRIVAGGADPELEDSAWMMTLAMGAGLGLLMVAAAPWVARRLGAPMALLACALAAARVVNLASYMYAALLERQLRYGRFALVDSAASLGSFLPALGCAAAGGGAWALVAREAALAAAGLIGYRALARRRFHWRAAPGAIRGLIGFGAPLALMQAGMSAFWSSDRLALGSRAGAAAVGAYCQARYLADAVGTLLGPLVTQVAVPVYARSTQPGHGPPGAGPSDSAGADELYTLFAAIAVRAALLPALILALFPAFVVRVMLGPRWSQVAPLLPCFALYAVLLPLTENQRARLTGLQRTRSLAVLSVAMIAGAAGAPLCAWWRPGPRPVAIAVTAGLAAAGAAGQWLVGCRLDYRRVLGAPLCAGAGTVAVYRLMAQRAISEPWLMVAVIATYAGLSGTIERRRLRRVWSLLRDFNLPAPAHSGAAAAGVRRSVGEPAEMDGER